MKDTMQKFSLGPLGNFPAQDSGLMESFASLFDTTEGEPSSSEMAALSRDRHNNFMQELKMNDFKLTPRYPKTKPWAEVDFPQQKNMVSSQYLKKDLNLARMRNIFVPSQFTVVTRKDQYNKTKMFERTVMRKQDASDGNVLNGVNLVESISRSLQQVQFNSFLVISNANFRTCEMCQL